MSPRFIFSVFMEKIDRAMCSYSQRDDQEHSMIVGIVPMTMIKLLAHGDDWYNGTHSWIKILKESDIAFEGGSWFLFVLFFTDCRAFIQYYVNWQKNCQELSFLGCEYNRCFFFLYLLLGENLEGAYKL